MKNITIDEQFDILPLDQRLSWFCPPKKWHVERSKLIIEPEAKTDYWQKTHYGFVADNGHFLYTSLSQDFVLTTRVRFFPSHQYDQAGLMVRISPEFWIKTSVEYELEAPCRLGAVVTNYGYSDWSTQNYYVKNNELELRIRREGEDYIVEYSEVGIILENNPEKEWIQIRMAHLARETGNLVQCGLYACSPIAAGYLAEFDYLRIEEGR
jgi:regulation of enolase protein 1 (concanavalin A-like superfamily)